MRTIAVIPARYRSKRLPGKPLAELHGKTMIERVYERASRARLVDAVLVATDDERIREAVRSFGGEAIMTSSHHPSGGDRVAEAIEAQDVDWVVNVQGDEPLLAPEAIDDAVRLAWESRGAITTLRSPIQERGSLLDRNVVKVVADRRGFALYFSRSPIPAPPPEGAAFPSNLYYKHLGIYVYPKDVLLNLTRMPPSPLELAEKLEQLRALENGIAIRLEDTEYESIAVDTPADLERVRELLATGILRKERLATNAEPS